MNYKYDKERAWGHCICAHRHLGNLNKMGDDKFLREAPLQMVTLDLREVY